MKAEEFDEIVERRLTLIGRVLASKAKEYAREDRLHNFKRSAECLRCSPARACLGKMVKHFSSVLDLVDDLDAGRVVPDEVWDEKIGDVVNYFILLEAIVKERK